MKKILLIYLILFASSCNSQVDNSKQENQKYRTIYYINYLIEKDTMLQDITYGDYKSYKKKNDTVFTVEHSDKYVFIDKERFLNLSYRYLFLVKKNDKSYKVLDRIVPLNIPNNDGYDGPFDFTLLRNGDILIQMGYEYIYMCVYRIVDEKFKLIYKTEEGFITKEDYSEEEFTYFEVEKDYIKIYYRDSWGIENKIKYAKIYNKDGKYILER